MVQGIVTDIQRFSVHDGPGIRTTVFLKGCNLRCLWCHNPETQHPQPELQYDPDRCIGCLACLSACPQGAHAIENGHRLFHRQRCLACGKCTRACYSGSLLLVGKLMSPADVMAEVLQDHDFYRDSGGGVTISGGEPLSQLALTREILRLSKAQGLHTAIETNMAWPWDRVAQILPFTDLIMMDIKMMDSSQHEKWTGLSNAAILANARRLAAENVPLVIRTPIVPGLNDTPQDIASIAHFIAALPGVLYYELLPYNPLGKGKSRKLGRAEQMPEVIPASRQEMRSLSQAASRWPIQVRVAGDKQTHGIQYDQPTPRAFSNNLTHRGCSG